LGCEILDRLALERGEVAGFVLGIIEMPSGLFGCSLGSQFWLETEVVGGDGEVGNA
jgi:hypothetical protein